ncbi:MAG TPA: helix-turn-helix transcriptional regulator [Clostridiales bacterium]|nr:helix-turn-helix transcriptional regulator [Clostridiales bacterium]
MNNYLRRVFSGEILSFCDVRVPLEEIEGRYISKGVKPAETDMYQDITCFPLWDEDGAVIYVIALFMTKRTFRARLDAVKAREYIDEHWLDDFNLDKIADAAGVSSSHLMRLFKKYIGKTPYSYYQDVKLEKIKEALGDPGLSISEAFTFCGVDYSGCFAGAFKRTVGMTPSQYRKALSQQTASIEGRLLSHTTPFLSRKEEERLFRILGLFPIPIQIFRPNGDIIFVNEAVLQAWNVRDTGQIIGKYNLIKDPFVNDQFGLKEHIRCAFQGETVLIPDIRIPLESFWAWYKTRSTVYDIEAIYTDILNFPVPDARGRMTYMMSIFFTSRIYQGRADVAKVKEYLENHWREAFDAEAVAKTVNLSPSHLSRLFKKHTGITPYSYYQEVKINRLKAALKDQTLSIAEAFLSCGFEYTGNWTRFFKEKVGMTPSEYRKTVRK